MDEGTDDNGTTIFSNVVGNIYGAINTVVGNPTDGGGDFTNVESDAGTKKFCATLDGLPAAIFGRPNSFDGAGIAFGIGGAGDVEKICGPTTFDVEGEVTCKGASVIPGETTIEVTCVGSFSGSVVSEDDGLDDWGEGDGVVTTFFPFFLRFVIFSLRKTGFYDEV